MTEQKQKTAWVPRDERRVSPTPTEIPPHPDHGDLPPCEVGLGAEKPCSRLAKWHYGYAYYCAEHMQVSRRTEDLEDAELELWQARRFLWKAELEDFERLVNALGDAVKGIENYRRDMERALQEARREAEAS